MIADRFEHVQGNTMSHVLKIKLVFVTIIRAIIMIMDCLFALIIIIIMIIDRRDLGFALTLDLVTITKTCPCNIKIFLKL